MSSCVLTTTTPSPGLPRGTMDGKGGTILLIFLQACQGGPGAIHIPGLQKVDVALVAWTICGPQTAIVQLLAAGWTGLHEIVMTMQTARTMDTVPLITCVSAQLHGVVIIASS